MSIATLIIDDTVTYRKILTDAAAKFRELAIVGTAPSGSVALKKMAQTPVNLVLLDIHMPDMDGVETLRRIKAEFPRTFVVMVSGISTRGADTTIAALELGALDFIQKPEGASPEENFRRLVDDLKPLVRLVEMRMAMQGSAAVSAPSPAARKASERSAADAPAPKKNGLQVRPAVVAIGVSTGGPEALARLLPQLPADLAAPVVLVQHMPPIFTKSLAESLAKKSRLRIVEASEGEEVRRGTVYIAPGGRHMVVRRRDGAEVGVVIGLNDGPPENSCRPAVDVLFRSVASVYGERGVLAVVLTGMGSDGCAGVRACKRASCFCITQSVESCVVYGMPRAVDEAGLADLSVPLDRIAGEIVLKVNK
jgi:two-component system chemotaxis response regulator CheB